MDLSTNIKYLPGINSPSLQRFLCQVPIAHDIKKKYHNLLVYKGSSCSISAFECLYDCGADDGKDTSEVVCPTMFDIFLDRPLD